MRSASSGRSGSSRETGTPPSTPFFASFSITSAALPGTRMVNSLKKRVVEHRHALDLGERLGERHGVGVVDAGEAPQAGFAQQRHVDGEGQHAQAGVGADVGGRLLAADVLLARRQGQHEAAPAFLVDGLAAQAPGHLPHVFLACGEQADIGAAEGERIADRLALADDDVGAHGARRPHEAERDGLRHHGDQQRAGGMRLLGQLAEIVQMAVEVRRLHHHARHRIVDMRGEVLVARRCRGRHDGLVIGKARHRRDGLAIVRVQVAGQHRLAAPGDAMRHQHGFRRRRRAVVHGGVGHLHPRQHAPPGSGTRTGTAACPGRSRADRACRRSGTPSAGSGGRRVAGTWCL